MRGHGPPSRWLRQELETALSACQRVCTPPALVLRYPQCSHTPGRGRPSPDGACVLPVKQSVGHSSVNAVLREFVESWGSGGPPTAPLLRSGSMLPTGTLVSHALTHGGQQGPSARPVGAPPMLHARKALVGRPAEGAFLTLYRKTQPFLRMSQSCGERSRGQSQDRAQPRVAGPGQA